jgi:hypothetical protein
LFPPLHRAIGLIAVVSVAALVAWVSLYFDQVELAPDSTTYIKWSPLVPLGYPLFLSGVKLAFGTLGWAGVVQLTLALSACVVLAISVKNVVQGEVIQLGVLVLLLCYIPTFWYAGWILSEAVFVPLILLNLAAAIFLIARQQIRYALMLAVTAALILFVRPAGYYIPMGIMFLLIAQRGRALWMLKWACLPFVVCTVATLVLNVGIRGNSVPSQMGRVMFPTVAFLFEPQFATGPYQEFAPAIEKGLKEHREGYAKSPGWVEQVAFSLSDYNSRLAAMDAALDETCLASGKTCSLELKERVYLNLFLSTVFSRPLDYATLVGEQMVEAWRIWIFAGYDHFRNTYLQAASNAPLRLAQIQLLKLPMSGEETRLRPGLIDAFPGRLIEVFDEGYRSIRGQRWLIYLTGFVTLIAIPIAMFFRRDSAYWLSLGYCGIMIHGSILLTTAVSVFLDRYAVPVDPVILVSGAIIIGRLVSWSLSKIGQLEASALGTGLLKRLPGFGV